MATSINVSKKSVADLLATGKDMPFVIILLIDYTTF